MHQASFDHERRQNSQFTTRYNPGIMPQPSTRKYGVSYLRKEPCLQFTIHRTQVSLPKCLARSHEHGLRNLWGHSRHFPLKPRWWLEPNLPLSSSYWATIVPQLSSGVSLQHLCIPSHHIADADATSNAAGSEVLGPELVFAVGHFHWEHTMTKVLETRSHPPNKSEVEIVYVAKATSSPPLFVN